jgi:archaellum component FlaF (FlaF/FlaG flagellin family)
VCKTINDDKTMSRHILLKGKYITVKEKEEYLIWRTTLKISVDEVGMKSLMQCNDKGIHIATFTYTSYKGCPL